MTAEILSVGTELLLGDIVNTNAAFLSRELANLGIAVYRQATVGDNHERLTAQIKQSLENADMVIISGGLGPTLDDITKPVAAEYFGRKLVIHEESLERIKKRFEHRELPENVHLNALIPEGATALQNDFGSAPGCIIEENGKSKSENYRLHSELLGLYPPLNVSNEISKDKNIVSPNNPVADAKIQAACNDNNQKENNFFICN